MNQSQKQFKEFATLWRYNLAQDDNGFYVDSLTQRVWDAWQAANDKAASERISRGVDVEQILFDVANGKRPALTQQDCRILALRLGTPRKQWSEQMINHIFGGYQ